MTYCNLSQSLARLCPQERQVQSLLIVYVGRDSSVGIATRYGLEGLWIESRWGARYSASIQSGPGAQPASYIMGTGTLPGIKRPGRGFDHPPQLEPRLKKELLYSSFGPSWRVLGRTLPFIFTSPSLNLQPPTT